MLGFIKAFFGSRPQNVIPAGVRDVVEFAWTEPSEEGQPSDADISRLVEACSRMGWGDVQASELGHAVEIGGERAGARLSLDVGHNGEGPWLAFVELLAMEDMPDAAKRVSEIHGMLVELGATGVRWYERSAHSRGDGSDPWPQPVAG